MCTCARMLIWRLPPTPTPHPPPTPTTPVTHQAPAAHGAQVACRTVGHILQLTGTTAGPQQQYRAPCTAPCTRPASARTPPPHTHTHPPPRPPCVALWYAVRSESGRRGIEPVGRERKGRDYPAPRRVPERRHVEISTFTWMEAMCHHYRWPSGKGVRLRSGRSWVGFPLSPWGCFRDRVIPVTSRLALQWLPCQAPGVIGSAMGLLGPVSVYCDWMRWKV